MSASPDVPQRLQRGHLFFPGLALLMSATVLAGFWFTYFGPVIRRTYPAAGLPLHLHGWSFFLWYLLLPVQAILIARRHERWHRLLGKLSAGLVAVMAGTGVLVVSIRVEEALRFGQPMVWLLYGALFLAVLVLFVGFYAAAIRMALAGRYEAHKRLIIVASAIGLAAGLARLIMFMTGFHPLSVPVGTLGCAVFIVIGMGHDLLTRRRIHPVYWLGLVVMLATEAALLPQFNPDGVAWVNEWLGALGERLGWLYQPAPTVEF